jgi:DNA replication protein DnaC
MKRRRSLRSIRKSGLGDMLSRYTFDNYETPDERRALIKDTAKRFVDSDTGWFFIAGHSGSGKSHICTAICSALIDKGNEVKYMLWRDENTALKSCITEYDEYQRRINKLKNVPVLYIDDFWKVRDGSLTNADVNLTFEIINARYNDITKRTIISTELMYSDIIRVDEAIGGRIFERSRGFSVKAPDENWRLRM